MMVPKVDRKTVDDLVASLNYQPHHFPGTTLTIAVALMPDGFMVSSGFSATAHPGLFDEETGRKLAIAKAQHNATEALWQFEGYKLKSQQTTESQGDR
ncbi:Gp49 family protein [Citrobacter rodentium]|uniref:Phage protein n=2 Tax=Citrobacter rodentium TaxID=67825 RepID=A0A482PBK6_CITRO|nr:Gp49 family protein [Citrobacter rodentium]KIQ52457.1 hypothetical protein TA05_04960 [Citrobacter rodentium]QBY27558.1 hypothetical protein E2R62_01020 [Citrobacter rodentium]UHO30537.1 hypothetical protein K7R23_21730 [Citrobacter rodentium NBRC 105723 = DSM 16636]CBG87690.1 hypothetical prophage protein [Citrobacter rodentium ICC168]HAT8014989.1 hypothetical protein [Citrobacter rodentium NBRC 105723 = DSM 16636]